MGLKKKPFENNVGKGEIACTSNFSFSHYVFYSIKNKNYDFCYICCLQMLSVRSGPKFCQLWELVNSLPNDKSLDMIKLKAFADNKLNVAKMKISIFDRLETRLEKEKMLVTRMG